MEDFYNKNCNIESKTNVNLPWIEKYKANEIDELILPQLLKNKIIGIINDRNIPNIIITGSPGIGKSITVKIIAREIYGKYYNDAVLELGLLDERCIKFIQNDMINFCKTKIPYKKNDEANYPKYKLIIFDESDNIILRIQDQISNVMENYNEYVRFAFTCNSSSDICEGIQTKSVIWRFPLLNNNLIKSKLAELCNSEKIEFEEKALEKIAEISHGDLRSAINKLEIVNIKHKKILLEHIDELYNISQEVIINNLFKYILKKDIKNSLKQVLELKKKSYSGSDITMSMLSTIKSEICNYIPENTKIKLCDKICAGIYNISNVMDSDLQLCNCIVEMINYDK